MDQEQKKELRFDGRVAIISGSGGKTGLGQEVAILLAQRGCKVVINGRRTDMVDATVAEIREAGHLAVPCYGTVATREGAERLVQTAIDEWGRLDIVINNAGIGQAKPVETWTDDEFETIMRTNVYGPAAVSRAAWPHMKKQQYGRMLNMTSLQLLGSQMFLYGASKGALYSMTRALAVEGLEHNILVNALSPVVQSEGSTNATGKGSNIDLWKQKYTPRLPVAHVAAWLAHEDMKHTGELITASGPTMARQFIAETRGIGGHDSEFTAEFVRDNVEEAFAEDGYTVVTSVADSFAKVLPRRPAEL